MFVDSHNYDLIGNLQSLKYANGVTNLYQYDAMNRLTNLSWKAGNTALGSFAYTLGSTGNRTALAETVNSVSRTYAWSYDYLYRLTGENLGSLGAVNYKYDSAGNRTNRTSTVSQLSNTNSSYNANDWLISDTYDDDGNTIASSANVYEYNVMNRLTNVNSGSILIAYDGDGNRVSKTVGGTTTYYLVDNVNPSGYAQVMEEYRGSTLTNVYNYALDLISQRVPGASTNYFIYDGHGSTRILTDAGGNIVNAFVYDAYGTLIASNGTPQTLYLYCGQQFDTDLGLYYNRARYLNGGTGRFWTMDSTEGDNEDPLSLHKYLYAEDNPVDNDDPSGNASMLSMILAPISSELYAGIDNPALIGQAMNFISSLGVFTPVAENANRIAGIVFGETATIVPQLKKGMTKNNGDPSNWDLSSRAWLNGARVRIAEIANLGKRSVSPPVIPTPTTAVQTAQWQDCVYAANLAQGKTSKDSVFIWPSDDGKTPTKNPLHTGGGSWYYDYRPYAALGPFRCVGGGDVPKGNNTYIFFYTGIAF